MIIIIIIVALMHYAQLHICDVVLSNQVKTVKYNRLEAANYYSHYLDQSI